MQCPHCSETIPDDSEFCPECGKRIAAARSRSTIPILIGVGAVVVVFAFIVIALFADTEGDDEEGDVASATTSALEAESSEPDAEPADLTETGGLTSGVAVGDCLTDPTFRVVDCSEPHMYEAFVVVQYEDADSFPGEDAILEYTEAACLDAFEDYVGVPFEESELLFTYWFPDEDFWNEGDREIACFLFGDEEVTESFEGSGL